jgi:alpha-D-xyloside xylohydrolase
MVNRRSLLKGTAFVLAGGAIALKAETVPRTAEAETLALHPILPGVWKATLGVPESYTPVGGRTISPDTRGLAQMTTPGSSPIAQISGKIGPRGCLLTLPLAANENIYGFGLQMLSFAQRGKKKTIRVNADPEGDTGDSHAPAPFYVTTNGYGVLVDTCRHVSFYCGDARPRPAKAASGSTSAVPTPDSMRNLPPDDPGVVTVEVPRAKGVDVYLFAGPSMMDAVRRYNLFSGGGVAPPEWGLGFWYRAYGRANASEIVAIAQDLRDSKIPCDVLGLEPGWQSHSYSCSFQWDAERFSDPRAFIESVKRLGYRINLWEHAFTHPSSPLFAKLLPYAADYGVWGGLVPDFAGAPARKIFGEYHGKELIDLGISGFKLDECDNSDYTGGWSFPEFAHFPSGLDGEQMHQVFGLRYQDAILRQFEERQKPTYNLVRSSGALAAPYPFVLYSDLYGHREFVRALVNAGFSGLLWCPEVRDAANDEDLVRRLQTVIFSPLAMVNAWYIKNPPWKQIDQKKNNADDLSAGWRTLESRCRSIIEWRMRLVPYLRGAFAEYELNGTPPFRALIMDDPGDESLLAVDDEYMMGDRMLVAPLFADEDGRKIVLPKGEWHDFWTGKVFQGGRSYTVPGSHENIPVYVKAGSILPLAGVGLTTGERAGRELTVLIFGDGSLPWKMGGPAGFQVRRSHSGKVEMHFTGTEPDGYKIAAIKQMSGV